MNAQIPARWWTALRWLLGALMLWAAVSKLANPTEFLSSIYAYKTPLPPSWLQVVAVVLPWPPHWLPMSVWMLPCRTGRSPATTGVLNVTGFECAFSVCAK